MDRLLHLQHGNLIWRVASGSTVEIVDIVVENLHRRSGIGRSMVNQLIDDDMPKDARLLWAITRSSNFIAQEFYEELGFRVVGVLRDFYKDEGLPSTTDAIMYGLDIRRNADGKHVR